MGEIEAGAESAAEAGAEAAGAEAAGAEAAGAEAAGAEAAGAEAAGVAAAPSSRSAHTKPAGGGVSTIASRTALRTGGGATRDAGDETWITPAAAPRRGNISAEGPRRRT